MQQVVNCEADDKQQFSSGQSKPDASRDLRLGQEAGVEGVARTERRAGDQDARTEQGEWVSSTEQYGQTHA